ncbi:MAG: RNB domain-containing ribonuclease [Lachnospiraceae bacterium]|nr:RNB domain-containing ribonuclease [Lachnospiraceae bacterium]
MDRQKLEEKKETVYGFISNKGYTPMKQKEIAQFLSVPRAEKEEFAEVIDSLIADGKIIVDQRGKVKKADEGSVAGIFCGTNKGFGFVTVEGEYGDIFIAPDNVNGARDKDKVLISILDSFAPRGRSREGVVLSILERGSSCVIGTFQRTKTYGFVVPDNQKFGSDIYIPHGFTKGAVTGHKVEVEITDFGGKDKNAEGHIIEIIGHIDDPKTDIMSVIRAYGIPVEFPEGVINQLTTIPQAVAPEDIEGRLDLRSTRMVTIDGEDAKDLDDAVSLEFDGQLYHLGVHIADVTNYVKENSPLDKEALKRGTSNYLIDSVIPMLPHELSNGICSLNQGVDRLALSVIMDIDPKGTVVSHKICETVINVDRRMAYTNVNRIICGEPVKPVLSDKAQIGESRNTNISDKNDNGSNCVEQNSSMICNSKEEYEKAFAEYEKKKAAYDADMQEYAGLVDMFMLMEELAEILRSRRMKRGSIDFDFPECKIEVDDRGVPIDIHPYERNKATRIIEDFMLIANETVAEDYFWQELPFVYRTHENPDPEKITKLGIFINNFGYTIKMTQDDIHPKELQKLLNTIAGSEEETLISRLTLRSLKQAKYTTSCDGHFGLAAKYYCHFTSPIRRYPDLQIHRIIKENLSGKLDDHRINHYNKILDEVAIQSSKTERRADEAEREVEKLKKVEFMEKYIGELFEGVISGVSSWGMHVELPNTVEGVIPLVKLEDDYYYFDEEHYMLVGEHTKKTYKLGEKVKVRVETADKVLRTIEFKLAENDVIYDPETGEFT